MTSTALDDDIVHGATDEPLWARLFPWVAFLALAAAKIAVFLPSALGYSSEDEQLYLGMARELADGRVYADPHYPPLHPASLIPALGFDDPYRAGIALMALYSSALVIPVWFLARELVGARHACVVTALTMLVPFHYTVPRTLMSENTYYPILIALVYFVVAAGWKRLALRDTLTGLLVGALMLIRYQTLVFIPGLAFGWLLRERLRTGRWLPDRSAILRAVLLTATSLAVFLPWPILHMSRGLSAAATVGADVQLGPGFDPAQLTLDRLATYTSLYVGSWALWLAPALGLIALGLARLYRDRLESALSRYTVTVLLMAVPLLGIITRHSWRSRYNFPEPLRIQNRYGIYVVILGIVLAYAVSVRAPLERRLPAVVHWLLTLLVPAGMIVAGYWLVFEYGFVPAPTAAAVDTSGGGDTYHILAMGSWLWPIALGSLVVISILLWRRSRATATVTATAIALFFVAGAPTYLGRLAEPPDFKLHARELAIVADEAYPDLGLVSFAVSEQVISESGVSTRRFLRGIRPNMELASNGRSMKAGELTDPAYRWAHVFVFSAEEYYGPTSNTYEVDGNTYVYVEN